ncbi:Scavenger receptor class B member 1 [Halotydeus destructor]|nr:Scavenger receptor class B member 1 [Halotydeus destructor]
MSSQKDGKSVRQRLIFYGAIFGLIGIFIAVLLPYSFEALIRSQMKLVPDGAMFKNWQNMPLPIMTKYHFFHVINPEAAIRGAKLQVREVGPFVFEQWRRKEVIEWRPEDDTVKYYEYKKYLYRPDLSTGEWDMDITVVNPVVAGLANVLHDTIETVPLVPVVVSPFLYTVVGGVLAAHKQTLFMKTTPKQMLLGHKINIFDTVQALVEPLRVFGVKKEDIMPTEDLPNNAFGIINGKNDTKNGPFEMYTGVKDPEKYGYIKAFKGDAKMDKWSSDECNKVHGSDGSQFPPFRMKKEKLPIFGADLCRTLRLIYDDDDRFKGIPVWRMKLDPKLWETPKVNPANECYCMHKKRPDRCGVKGLIDLGGCLNGAPLAMSLPHFLATEPHLGDLVDGLHPDPAKHGFNLMFEPRLGMPLNALARIQLNVRVEKTSFLRGFSEVRSAFIPFVWVEEGGGLDDFLALVVRIALVYVIGGAEKLAIAMAVISWFLCISAFIYGVLCPSNRKRLYPRDDIHPSKMSEESESMTSSEDPDSPPRRKLRDAQPTIGDVIRTKIRQVTRLDANGAHENKVTFASPETWQPYYVKRSRSHPEPVDERKQSLGQTNSAMTPSSSPQPVEERAAENSTQIEGSL